MVNTVSRRFNRALLSLFLATPHLSGAIQASANTFGNPPGSGRAYTQQIIPNPQSNITGVKGTFQSGANDLSAVSLSGTNNPVPFINKNIWMITNEASTVVPFGCWIEAQVTKTNFVNNWYSQQGLTGNSFNGYWIGTQRASNANTPLYTDFPYGANNSPTAASGGNVEIVKGSSNGQWIIKVNGSVALTLNDYLCSRNVTATQRQLYYPTGGSQSNVGIESNDNASSQTFVNATKTINVQTKNGTGSYATPPPGSFVTYDNNSLGWRSVYSNGQITFTK